MLLSALGKSLFSGRKKKKSKSGKEMSQQVLNRSNKEDEKPTIKPQNSLVPLSIKTTTIPTANLITTKEDSVKDKLLMIKNLLGLQVKFRLSSFFQKMKNMKEERRKKREKELEEEKEKKKKSPFLTKLLPKTGILDSLTNFLAFLGGGFLLNILLNNLPVLEAIGKKLAPIATGIMQFSKFMWDGVIGFIVTAYDKYDELRKSIEEIGGEDALDKFDKVSDLLKKVINGALIMAAIALVAKPFMPGGGGGKGGGGVTPICNCAPQPVTIPQLITVTAASLARISNVAVLKGSQVIDFVRKLLEALGKKTNEVISGNDVKDPDTVPVQPLGINWRNVRDSILTQLLAIAKGATDLQAQTITISAGVAWWVVKQLFSVPVNAAELEDNMLSDDIDTTTEKTPKIQNFIPVGKDIIQWYDLEDEPDFMKNIISLDDIAMDTSYSNGSYGVITNNTTIIQPIIQEV